MGGQAVPWGREAPLPHFGVRNPRGWETPPTPDPDRGEAISESAHEPPPLQGDEPPPLQGGEPPLEVLGALVVKRGL